MIECDFLIVGAGIAGASAGYALSEAAPAARIVVAEREETAGYHSTGRSAAFLLGTYGVPAVRALTRGSRAFLESPPVGFADHPLLTPRSVLHIAREDQRALAEQQFADWHADSETMELVQGARIDALQPCLRPGYAVLGLHDPSASDIDVAALHQGYLRGLKAAGGRLVLNAEILGLEWRGGRWHVDTAAGPITAGVVIDAGGAWGDDLAALAGLKPLGLVPKRRTAFTFDGPAAADVSQWPITVDIEENFYFRPDAGRLLGTPADETPMPPCDVQPEELDVAIGIDRIQRATTMTVERLHAKWAGLRSFYADKAPVNGPDPRRPEFIWVTGQGGFGIMTSRAMGRLAAAFALGRPMPADLADAGVTAAALAPDRFPGTGA